MPSLNPYSQDLTFVFFLIKIFDYTHPHPQFCKEKERRISACSMIGILKSLFDGFDVFMLKRLSLFFHFQKVNLAFKQDLEELVTFVY
jgi:hypothetical protein